MKQNTLLDIQIQRIKEKLAHIESYDKEWKVFGSNSHEYQIGPGINHQEITVFEKKYGIELPEAYVAFVTQIGNGNPQEEAYMGSGAGPYYGIYPFGEGIEDLPVGDGQRYLSYPCLLHPTMTEEEWKALTSELYDDSLSDQAYDAIVGPLYGGLLPLGTQGCAITTCLILNGPYLGRIVYLNDDYKPQFAFETHFLDWYERWLDEIISGELLAQHAGWFGYKRGGTAVYLWNAFQTTTNEKEQLEYLEGLISKKDIEEEIIQALIEKIPEATTPIRQQLISILAKVDYNKSLPFLEEEVKESLLFVLQQIHWYGANEAAWLPVLDAYKDKIAEEETYRFFTYIALKATTDFAYLLLPGLQSPLSAIRSQAVYSLGKATDKQQYATAFMTALQDEEDQVVLYALQALGGVEDDRLRQAYQVVYHKYKDSDEDNYIMINLNHQLKEKNLTVEDLKN
ncbi:SMI1/KNR4 family protein [Myroides sp. C15-4]|uniref:SMI1/KNR4 family protein n=1 Tax=Myroides sp. C15-4 TaxID=3400532 RepID=UPI003D2F79EC